MPQRHRLPAKASLIWAVVRLGILIEQGFGGHDHAVDAVAALHGLLVDEGLLDLVHLLGVAQAFERGHGFVLRCADGSDAGADRVAVHDHGAGAALGQAAAEFGTVELQIVAQCIEQRHVRLGVDDLRLAVYSQGYFCHWL